MSESNETKTVTTTITSLLLKQSYSLSFLVKKLCVAEETDEKLFWKLLKGQRSSSQMSAFLVNGAFITEENDIRDMWACHFEVLGTPLLV